MSLPENVYDEFNRAIRYSADAEESEDEGEESPTTITCDDSQCEGFLDNGETPLVDAMVPHATRGHRSGEVCPACCDTNYEDCDDCDQPTHSSLTETARTRGSRRENGAICPDCFTDHYLTCPSCDRSTHSDEDQAAHDLWLTRNGHGAGFYDGDWDHHGEDVAEELVKALAKLGEQYVEVEHHGDSNPEREGEYTLHLHGGK